MKIRFVLLVKCVYTIDAYRLQLVLRRVSVGLFGFIS